MLNFVKLKTTYVILKLNKKNIYRTCTFIQYILLSRYYSCITPIIQR